MSDEKTKQKEVIKCSVEKETVPKNQIDLMLLRSTFEKFSSRSDQRQSHPGDFTDGSTIPAGSVHGDDAVDQSQPSMAEVLVKFRRMERSRRPGSETGRRVRSSSLEGYERLRFSDVFQESGQNRRSIEFEDSEDQESTPQIRNLVALFSHIEGKKSSRGSRKKRETAEQQRFGGKSKGTGSQKEREPSQGSDGEGETELPEEGAVQVLLLQWKALEKPLKKKRMSWVERQASRQAEQRKAQSAWRPVAASLQKTPVSGQKATGTSTKSPTAFQNTAVTSKKPTVAFQGTTAVVASPKSQMTTQKTQVTIQKTQTAPQKTQVAPQKSEVAPQKSKVEIQKQDVRDGGIKDQTTPTRDIWALNGFLKNSQGQRQTSDFDERTGKGKEQNDDHVTFDGIKNMTDKFRELERRNASIDELDGPHNKRKYKWDVKPVATLGRLQGQSGGTGPIVVTYDRSTVTPPSSPEPGHVSERRQPDVVEHSNGWKSEVEEFPLPSQTRNLRAKFEAKSVHQSD